MTVTAYAMGYENIVAMGKSLLKIPEKTVLYQNGSDIVHSADSRNYTNIEEMIAAEKIDIAYPRELPDDYIFDTITVLDVGEYLDITINSTYNYIIMQILTNNTYETEEYTEVINGVKYDIVLRDNVYQAYCTLNNNYYVLSCADKEDLLYTVSKIK